MSESEEAQQASVPHPLRRKGVSDSESEEA